MHENEEKYHEIRFYPISFTPIHIKIQYFVYQSSFLFKICNAKKGLHCICRYRAINAQSVSKGLAVPLAEDRNRVLMLKSYKTICDVIHLFLTSITDYIIAKSFLVQASLMQYTLAL